MTILIAIPARWGSTRLPGKPLVTIAGRSMLHRVIDLARRATRDRPDVVITVATDDARIAAHANDAGCAATLTDPAIASGSGRALAAALATTPRPSHLLNLQGDAPLLAVGTVQAVLDALAEPTMECVTPVTRLDWPTLDRLRTHKAVAPFSGTTCVRDAAGRALWFSKQVLPAIRDEAALRLTEARSPVLRHLGIYGFAIETLARFEAAPPTDYERLEGLEQLRMLTLGIRIQTVDVDDVIGLSGIDTRADLEAAERLIAEFGDPFGR